MVMSDALPPGDSSWRSVAVYAIITLIALSAEYIRRIMPPPRRRPRRHDEDELEEGRHDHHDLDDDDTEVDE